VRRSGGGALPERLPAQRQGGNVPHTRRLALLAAHPSLSKLPVEVLAGLSSLLREEEFAVGTTVVREGEQGDRLYLIVTGRAEVSTAGKPTPLILATLGSGDLFGEIALLTPSAQRQATVTALTPLLTLSLSASAFLEVLRAHLQARIAFETAADALITAKFLKQATPFSALSPERTAWLTSRLRRLSVAEGEVIVRQGEEGDACYLLRAGRVEVTVREDAGEERRLAVLTAGMLFGETALLTAAPRNATVRALEPCELLALHRADLLEAMASDSGVGAELMELLRLRDRPSRVAEVVAEHRRTADGSAITILKHPGRGVYYRLSAEGWFIWERLDGRRTLRDLTMEYFAEFQAFAPHAIAEVVGGLAGAGLVEGCTLSSEVVEQTRRRSGWERFLQRANPMTWRVGFRNADAHLTRIYNGGAYLLYTPLGQILMGILAVAGLAAFFAGSRDALAAQHGAPGGVLLLSLIPAYLLAILVHEAGHALTVKACGREVLSVGLAWYVAGPVVFVDTSDMWLAGRRQRIGVSLAGPYANLLLGGLAAIGACLSSDPLVTAALWQGALVSYIIVLVNFDPVLEYDGYFVLMDLCERPNLRQNALAWLGRNLIPALRRPEVRKGHRLELMYGLGVLLYTSLMCANMLYGVRLVLQGIITRFVPPLTAVSLAWALAIGVVLLTIAGIADELRGKKPA